MSDAPNQKKDRGRQRSRVEVEIKSKSAARQENTGTPRIPTRTDVLRRAERDPVEYLAAVPGSRRRRQWARAAGPRPDAADVVRPRPLEPILARGRGRSRVQPFGPYSNPPPAPGAAPNEVKRSSFPVFRPRRG